MSIFVVHVVCVQVVRTLDDVSSSQYQYRLELPSGERSYFEFRERWRNAEFPTVSGMVPIIEGTVEANGRLVPLLGIDPLADFASMPGLVGHKSSNADFLVANSLIAQGTSFRVGDIVEGARVIATTAGTQEQLIADIATAQHMLNRFGHLDAVWLRVEPDFDLDWLEDYWPGLLTGFDVGMDSLAIEGYDVQPISNWNPMHRFSRSIAFNLGTLGVLAIFVAGFIVYEAIWSEFKRRELEIQRLFTLGVPRANVRTLFVFEALALGLVGSIVGVILGFGLVEFVLFEQASVGPASISWIAVWKAVCVGVAVAVSAALLATRTHVASIESKTSAAIVICSVLLSLYGIRDDSGLGGAFLIVFGLCAIHLVVVVPLTISLLWKFCGRLQASTLIARLNIRNAIHSLNLLRTPLSAMSVAVAAALGLGLMIASFDLDFTQLMDRRVQEGLHIASAGNVDLDDLHGLEGVTDVRVYYRARGVLESHSVEIVAADLDEWEAARYGYGNKILAAALIDEQIARRSGLNEGDIVSIDVFGGATISLPIAHVYSSYGDATGTVVVNKDSIETEGFIRDRITLQISSNEDGIVETIRSKYPNVSIASHSQIRQVAEQIFDRTFILANVMSSVAILVAIVGLAGTMFAMIGSQTEEYRLLRTLGVSHFKLNWMNLVQMTTFGIVVALVSLPFGLAIAWVLCELVNPRAFDWTIELHVLLRPILLPCLTGLIGVLLASLLTAFMQRSVRATASQPNVVGRFPVEH